MATRGHATLHGWTQTGLMKIRPDICGVDVLRQAYRSGMSIEIRVVKVPKPPKYLRLVGGSKKGGDDVS